MTYNRKNIHLLVLSILLSSVTFSTFGQTLNQNKISQNIINQCDTYIDSLPLVRTTLEGEEQVISGNVQAVGQQYNGINGSLSNVLLWARVNPASGLSTNVIRIVVYSVNLGLPGVILGTQNISIDSASICSPYMVTFATPIAINTNIIISIEPFSPSTDNFFIKRNTPPDGQNLNLIKLKQANQWFKNLAIGDPNYDYDFLIIPVKTVTLNSSFTVTQTGNISQFNNTSLNGDFYFWDFGDATFSQLENPSHQYLSSGTYSVKLTSTTGTVFQSCSDSIITPINVTITGLQDIVLTNYPKIIYNSSDNYLSIETNVDGITSIIDMRGVTIHTQSLFKNIIQKIDCTSLKSGVYILNLNKGYCYRFNVLQR